MNLLQDLRFAIRLLIKDRGFTLVAVLALALGIGVNATVFTFVNAVLIRGLPFDDPDRIMSIGIRDARDRDRGLSYLDFQDWRAARAHLLVARRFQRRDDEHQRRGRRRPSVTSDPTSRPTRFKLIGQKPRARPRLPSRRRRPRRRGGGDSRHGIWKNRYGGDPAVVGRIDQGQRDAGDRDRRHAGRLQVPARRGPLACRWRRCRT